MNNLLEQIKFDKQGLVVAITVSKNKNILMQAFMNLEAFEKTLETGFMHYWSRSRNELWFKGETSGNTQKVISIKTDCDKDSFIFTVDPMGLGAACHKGYVSCFTEENKGDEWVLKQDAQLKFDPKNVYS